ncbi:MAG: PrsW family intramembrane metalloprotease [Candidatus Bathyarchaeota archaeon]|nr:PrsW family intramembrane metalloprotease [Candidatus Bathyarchaeota archaeon]
MFHVTLNLVFLIFWVVAILLPKWKLSKRMMLCIALASIFVGCGMIVVDGLVGLCLLGPLGIEPKNWNYQVVIAPLLEESLKFLFILLPFVLKMKDFLPEITRFGAFSGLFYAFFENFLNATSVEAMLYQRFTPMLLHISTAFIQSCGVGSYLLERSKWRAFGLFLAAVIIHVMFNLGMVYLETTR